MTMIVLQAKPTCHPGHYPGAAAIFAHRERNADFIIAAIAYMHLEYAAREWIIGCGRWPIFDNSACEASTTQRLQRTEKMPGSRISRGFGSGYRRNDGLLRHRSRDRPRKGQKNYRQVGSKALDHGLSP
jgi:hypothetical protein